VQKSRQWQSLVTELQPAIKAGRFNEVYEQIRAAGLDLNNSRFDALAESATGTLSLESRPVGTAVSAVRVHSIEDFSEDGVFPIGQAPILDYRMIAGEYLVRLESESLAPLTFLVQVNVGQEARVSRALSETEEMVFINGGESSILDSDIKVPPFLIDRHEVTNAQFADFVTAGGYRNSEFWPDRLLIDGAAVSWKKAMETFVDRSGIPGPRDWSGGRYPAGKGDHPVASVSWYEATAYARWAGKELPSWEQWWSAALGETGEVFPWGNDVMTIEFRANFELEGTQPVGSYPLGVSPYGCNDMAGNVREWLRELDSDSHVQAVGGSWQDPTYMFEPSHAELFEPTYSNPAIGFRCVKPAPGLN
jgi:formylglycine-generating enzyme required for sulfatase activity